MNISEISIKNPVFAWMLMIALIVFGWIGFTRLGVSQMPDVDFPVITVSMSWEGAAPEIMESEVVDVLEDSLMSIDGIKEVTSSARQGNATVKLEFELSRNIDVALQEVQTKIAQAALRLPKEIDPAVITKANPEDNPIMWVGLSGEGKKFRELIDYAQDYLKPFLQSVSGVGDVILGGFLERNLRVWIDTEKLKARDLTVDDVIAAIDNEHRESPAGRIETSEKEYNIRVMGEALSPDAFGEILITQRAGRPIYKPFKLKDVARIEDGTADIRRIARINGKPAIGIGIKKQRGTNAVEVGNAIKKRLEEIKKHLGPGFELGINFDSTRFIKDSISELNFTMLLSAILTSIVCWLFLGSLGATFNVLLAIPTSLLGTFFVIYFFGFTLNTFTLLGLTLAIGIVVDDAIMVLENMIRHREMGKSAVQGALDGSKEISFAALAATIAIIAIFLPVAFMQGIVGKFFFQFGVTISIAVALSLLEALTLTPMRTSQFVGKHTHASWLTKKSDQYFKILNAGYQRMLAKTLQFKWTVIFATTLLFVGSLFLIKNIRQEFVPPQDQSMFLIRMQAPIGSSIEYTNEKFKLAEKWISTRPEVNRYFGSIGGFGGGEVDTGVLFVTMKQPKERKLTQQEFIPIVRKELNALGGIRAIVMDLSTGGFSADRGFPVEFSIRGPEWDKLGEISIQFLEEMKKAGLYEDIDSDYRVGVPEVRVIPDRAKAADRGVSMAALGSVVSANVGGIRAGKYTQKGRRYDVRVRLEQNDRGKVEDLTKLYVRNDRGEMISLNEVVRVVQKPALQTVTRRNRERSVGVFANLAKDISQTKAIEKVEKIGQKILPAGYHIEIAGGSKTFKESFQSLIFALLLGILVAYMVLGSQFNSFIHPFTVLLALPFSLTGALFALYFANQSLNIYSLIGILLLMGLVKKNSILLVDFTNTVRGKGKGVRDSLLEACPTRLRPILMTSISTIAAAIPPAIAIGPGAETRIPMAIVIIGGVTISTLLSLFVVPCAYEIFSPLERKKTIVS